MSVSIFNRPDFQHPPDGWYQIEAKGRHPNRQAGVIQLIDDEACEAIVDRFNVDADAGKLRHGHEMLIDHEHFKDRDDKETIAYGWLQRLLNRTDGYYGQIRWTVTGQKAVDGGDYRFFSTEYDPEDCLILNDSKLRELRPLRLDGLSLTNMNNNVGQRPITNRVGRQSHSAQAGNPRAAQGAAVRLIASLANAEQRVAGGSLASCYLRVMNRKPGLAAVASGKALSGELPFRQNASREGPALFAGRMLLQLAQRRNLPGLSQNLVFIRNRFPGLVRMNNRQAGFDALADMEPIAHDAYLKCGDTADPEANPQVKALWPDFHEAMQLLAVQYPELGFDERWQKMKESLPEQFWKFVLAFDQPPQK
ncbi:MAG: phage protease [Verrucomicrobiota bacterium]|jgi:hypothetical protein